MKKHHRAMLLMVLGAFSIGAALGRPYLEPIWATHVIGQTEYVCPPCGNECDSRTFDQPGFCPVCAMKLVEKGSMTNQPVASSQPAVERKKVAILIFDGVQIIDYTGPYEVFGGAGFEVYTVAEKADPITTAMGMRVTPRYTFENCPQPNILLIPGGGVVKTQNDPQVIKWIQDRAQPADYVLSVCNGAFILAKTGLLDGLTATTTYGLLEGFEAFAPKTKVVSDRRYVDNGKIITTAGLSSGIDGALHVVSKVIGQGRAQMVALGIEYNWQPESNYVRASLADKYLQKIFTRRLAFEVPAGTELKVLSTSGGTDQWEIKWQAQTELSPAEMLERLNRKLADEGKWSRPEAETSKEATKSQWKFTDEKGKAWNGAASVQPAPGEKNKLTLTVKITRSDHTTQH